DAAAPPFADGIFDAVTAGSSWHWWDGPTVAARVRELLRPGGALVTAWLDWVLLPGNLIDRVERLILDHNPGWQLADSQAIGPRWLRHAGVAGLVEIESFSFDLAIAYTHEGWRGRIRASAGVGASLAPEAVARFDAEQAALLAAAFPTQP